MVYINNSSIVHHFRDITIFTVYVTACDPENSFTFDTIVEITGSVVHGSILFEPIQPNPIKLTDPTQLSPLQVKQEAQLSLRDRATRACQLKSGKVLHKCRRLVFEKL